MYTHTSQKIPSRSSKLLMILIHTFHLNRTEFISVCLFKYEFQRWFRYQFVCCPWNNIKCVYSLNEFIDCCDVCVTHKTANVPGSQPFGHLANISEYVNKQAIVRGGVLFTRFKCYAYVTPCVIHSMGADNYLYWCTYSSTRQQAASCLILLLLMHSL